MGRGRASCTALAVLLIGAASNAARAEDAPAQPADAAGRAVTPGEKFADTERFEAEAIETLRRMVRELVQAKSLQVRVVEEYDALQPSGETFSFGKTVEMTVRRPDRMRVVGAERAGAQRISSYDGSRITVYDAERNAFATVERSGSLDSTLDFLRDEVGMKLPLAGLFSAGLGQLLLENMATATYVDQETVDGVDCDHVALRYADGAGIQVWVPRTGPALPHRLIMTFEDAKGRPQFRADFREWNLSPDVSDGVFVFQPPAGARAIPFVLPKRAAAPGAAEGSR